MNWKGPISPIRPLAGVQGWGLHSIYLGPNRLTMSLYIEYDGTWSLGDSRIKAVVAESRQSGPWGRWRRCVQCCRLEESPNALKFYKRLALCELDAVLRNFRMGLCKVFMRFCGGASGGLIIGIAWHSAGALSAPAALF